MLELMRKVLYTGIGLAALTEEKAHELVKDMETRGEVTSEEGKQLARELLDKAKQQKVELEDMVAREVEKAAQRLRLVPRSEFDALLQRVQQLEGMCCPPSTEDSL